MHRIVWLLLVLLLQSQSISGSASGLADETTTESVETSSEQGSPSCGAKENQEDSEESIIIQREETESIDEQAEEEEEWDEDTYDSMTISDLWTWFSCQEIFESERPAHNESTWSFLRGVYQGVTREDHFVSPFDSGFAIPVEVRQAGEGKGRGVFAARSVKEGELVWSSRQTARFHEAETYRQFLAGIPDDLACDVLQWAYIMRHGDEDDEAELRICVDLDDGSFMNGAYGEQEPNVKSVPDDVHEDGCSHKLIAIQDFDEGEEIVAAYGEFAVHEGWKEFELQ